MIFFAVALLFGTPGLILGEPVCSNLSLPITDFDYKKLITKLDGIPTYTIWLNYDVPDPYSAFCSSDILAMMNGSYLTWISSINDSVATYVYKATDDPNYFVEIGYNETMLIYETDGSTYIVYATCDFDSESYEDFYITYRADKPLSLNAIMALQELVMEAGVLEAEANFLTVPFECGPVLSS